MKHDFDRPAFLIQLGHLRPRRFARRQVREHLPLGVAVPSRLIPVDRDPSHGAFATSLRQFHRLFVDLFAARGLADQTRLIDRLSDQVPVWADHEPRLATPQSKQKSPRQKGHSAEVAIRDPQVVLWNGLPNLVQHRSFLSMSASDKNTSHTQRVG